MTPKEHIKDQGGKLWCARALKRQHYNETDHGVLVWTGNRPETVGGEVRQKPAEVCYEA